MDIAARYLPMSSVAGDFYDFIIVDEEHVGILIADVTGHGLPAALIASMLQMALVAESTHASDPGRVLRGLNHKPYAGNSRAILSRRRPHMAAYVISDLTKGAVSQFARSVQHRPQAVQ